MYRICAGLYSCSYTAELHPEAQKAIEGIPWSRQGYVFRGPNGDPLQGQSMGAWLSRNSYYKPWWEAVEKAGLQDVRTHDLRRTFCSRLLRSGVDIRTIADLIGNSTLNMLMIYAQTWGFMRSKAIHDLPPL